MQFKSVPFLALFLFLINTEAVRAQKYGVGLEIGYSHGIQTKNFHDAPFKSTAAYTLGDGINRQLLFHLYPDSSNWFVSAGFQHFMGQGSKTAVQGSSEARNLQIQHMQLDALRFSSRLNYNFRLKKLEIQIAAGILLPLYNKLSEETRLSDSLGFSSTQADLKYYTSLGFSGGLCLQVPLTKKIKFFGKGDLLILNSKLKSRKVSAYTDSENRDLQTAYPDLADRETNYRKDISQIKNNKTNLPALYNRNAATDKLSYTQSLSSIGLQVGFLFLF